MDLCCDFKLGGASELLRNILKELKSQPGIRALPISCWTWESVQNIRGRLVSDIQLGRRRLHMPQNLSESSEGAVLYLFEAPGMHKEGLEPQTQNSGASSIHQHPVTSYEKFKAAPRLNDTND